ncbi:MAG TPA: HAMP domain-containing protein, partial [Epsilonproteobacteria bacterium]|nr:HAMP domain-containing protein [Campylobacterota bacterium]
MKHKSLKTRVLLSFGAISFFLLVVFGFIFYYFLNQNMIVNVKNDLSSQAHSIKEQLRDAPYGMIDAKDSFALIENNQVVFKSHDFDFKDTEVLLRKNMSFFTQEFKEGLSGIYVLKFSKPFNGAVIVQRDEIDENFENVILIMIILEPILFLLFLFLANRMVDSIIKPLHNINLVAKKISIDNFHGKIPLTHSDDEIEALVKTFNTMIERLKEGVAQLDRFNSDVSHELRTPLTVIRGNIDVALKKDRDIEYYKNSLKLIQSESSNIQQIVEGLLQLSRYTKENIKKSFVHCDLNAILLETIEKYLPLAKAKNITLEIVKFEKATREANPLLIGAVFSNLIDNAIKYTPEGKKIYISLYTKNKIYFIVQDEGIGISPEVLPHITDSFYRVDEARNKKIKGFGLGLSIVKKSVDLHGGRLHVSSSVTKGTT